jgi:hypothetical protein
MPHKRKEKAKKNVLSCFPVLFSIRTEFAALTSQCSGYDMFGTTFDQQARQAPQVLPWVDAGQA